MHAIYISFMFHHLPISIKVLESLANPLFTWKEGNKNHVNFHGGKISFVYLVKKEELFSFLLFTQWANRFKNPSIDCFLVIFLSIQIGQKVFPSSFFSNAPKLLASEVSSGHRTVTLREQPRGWRSRSHSPWAATHARSPAAAVNLQQLQVATLCKAAITVSQSLCARPPLYVVFSLIPSPFLNDFFLFYFLSFPSPFHLPE